MKILGFVLSFTLIFLATPTTPSPPYWGGHPQFSVLVNMTNPDPVSHWQFQYYYDSIQNASRYEHYPPQQDEVCVSLIETPFQSNASNLQCNAIFATDGWLYVQYPQQNWCCKCTNNFGAVRYNWLQQNSIYLGINEIFVAGKNVQAQHWQKQGNYLNNYYCSLDQKMPYRFNETQNGKLKQWDFNTQTYLAGVFDSSLLSPPQNCETMCQGGCQYQSY